MRYPTSTTLLILSFCLYVAALFNDGFYIQAENPRAWSPGWGLLLVGWIALFDGVIAWLANPLLLVGWLMLAFRLKRVAAIFATAALACSSSFLLCQTILTDEAGGRAAISGYGTGYWLWLVSSATLLIASLVAMVESRYRSRELRTDKPSIDTPI